jgi:hypothetical protein
MNTKEFLIKWIADLRTPGLIQTESQLRKGDAYCCLGRFCEVHNSEFWNPNFSGEYTLPEGKSFDTLLPSGMKELYPDFEYSIGDEGALDIYVPINCVPDSVKGKYQTRYLGSLEETAYRNEKGEQITTLATLNDGGATFPEIADILEKAYAHILNS